MIKIDLIVIGNLGSGKTSLIQRFIDQDAPFQHNYLPTLGLNLVKKEFIHQGQKIKLCIWDTAGQDKYFSLTKSYFQKADGVIMVFDIADKDSFNRISDYWIKQVQECSKASSQSILVGNKIDLCEKRQVKFLEGQEFSQKYKLPYFEVRFLFIIKEVQRLEMECKRHFIFYHENVQKALKQK
ncbi:unnamed protein product [Paramecium sonneborni]|uniref:Rab-family small GTPase n=1 Tax=Paramecium sonneborni TaxID=65129 RepID=A0A8S1MV61_9CILI|nr:unnamed protein product [Paramecium sonneborni]